MTLWAIAAATAAAGVGQIVGVVFHPDGRPLPGARVVAGDSETVTDEGGTWRIVLPEGMVAVAIDGIEVTSVPVAGDATTELLVTLGDGLHRFLVETPVAPPAADPIASGPPGTLRGRITDAAGKALPGVRLFVRGSVVDAITDATGAYTLELPAGTWDISTVRAGYDTLTFATEVAAGATKTEDRALATSGLVLDDLVVRAPRIAGGTASVLDERQESSSVSDVLGAEQMSRAGDSDAASALRRVTGLTVVGSKYVYVRGLGDRYSATLLNGSALPSPEPEKRVVPLDLFPTSLLEAVVIQKTFSPDKPAEFGGGIVEVRTRAIPDDPILSLSVTGTYAAGTSFQTASFADAGPTDFWGLGKGYRALPDALAEASENEAIKPGGIFSDGGYDANELEAFGEMITPRWGLQTRSLPPDFGASITTGGKLAFGELEIGALGGGVFSNGWSIDQGIRSVYSQGATGLEAKRHTTFTEVQNRIRAGGALALGASFDDRFSLQSTTLLMRSSAGTALEYLADDPTGSNDDFVTRIDWEEQQLLFEQVVGHVDLKHLVLDGRYATAVALRDQPDRREYVRDVTEDGFPLSQRASWNEIYYSSLADHTQEWGVDAKVPFRDDGRLQIGGGQVRRERSSTTRRFTFNFQGSEGIDIFAPMEEVIVPENIGEEEDGDPGYLELEENTVNSDDYTAQQRLASAYALFDVPWITRFSTLLGARLEKSIQTVSTFELFDTSQTPTGAELETTDVMPAATATVGVGGADHPDDMLVRVGYGRTLSRPEFRELSSVAYYDYRSGRLLFGNPELDRAVIDNVDARWEWYPRAGETVSAGLFFKHFTDPIESIIAVTAVSGSVGTFDNATSATNLGAELDFRRRLVSDFWLTANTSFIGSRVDLSESAGNQTSDERPLQGQSPWVVNAQFSYENPDRRRNAALLYNAFGPRIIEVGTSGIPDTYELPVHRVDLVLGQGFGRHWQLRAKATNLLDWPARQRTGEKISEETRSGWGAGLTMSWMPI